MASTPSHNEPITSSSTPPVENATKSSSPIMVTTSKEVPDSSSPSSLQLVDSQYDPNLSAFVIRRNQFYALTRKNWIVLRSYWFINLLRCLNIPIAYYIFLGEAKNFFNTTNDLGLGQPATIRRLANDLHNPVYWLDTRTSTTASRFSAQQIFDLVLEGLEPNQHSLIRQVQNEEELGLACPQAFNGLSSCFGAVEISDITAAGSVVYTLRFDPGLNRVKVSTNSGDAETRTLPLQFAVDSAILQLNGAPASTYDQVPLEQPYTIQTNAEQAESQRRGFLGGVDQLTVLAFFIGMLGVVWHLPSSISEERGSGMTALLTTMGCGQLPRLLSWLCGPGAAYLPAWFVMGGSLSATLWTTSNKALCIFAHVLPGLAMASWSLFVATFFARANVSSIITTALAILMAIVALITKQISEGGGIVIGLLFPSASFVYEFIAISAYEHEGLAADATASHDGINKGPSILGQIVVQVIAIFLFPALTILLEHKLFSAQPFFQWLFRRTPSSSSDHSATHYSEKGHVPALQINNLTKQYSKKASSLAVDQLDLTVPRGTITCLLGSNGSGKSTTIGVVGGTIRPTSGSVFIDGYPRNTAPPGLLGVCPQKNVLYNQLTCVQHIALFRAIKHRRGSLEDPSDLLQRCELGHKLKSKPNQLSGGQKRRLQTAAALVGQSTVLMFDEATSGLDPLSRRAIWKILLAERGKRSILLTSHFLDEADLLGDHIVILAAPGKKLCEGTPIELKTRFGEGSTIQVSPQGTGAMHVLEQIVPGTRQIEGIEPGRDTFLVPSTEQADVAKALEAIEEKKGALGVEGYDVAGPSLESVFLSLNSEHARSSGRQDEVDEMEGNVGHGQSCLSDGAVASVFALILAQFSKRMVLYRRVYIPAIFAILVAVLGSIVPLAFFSNRDPSCSRGFTDREISEGATFWNNATRTTDLLYAAPEANAQIVFGTGFALDSVSFDRVALDQYNATVARLWNEGQPLPAGISLPGTNGGLNQFSYLADEGPIYPIAALNLVTNAGLASVRNAANAANGSPTITASFRPLSKLSLGNGLGSSLKWAVVFGLVQAVWPAFAALYPSAERNNRAKAMALTNGMRATPLWLGHLFAEVPVILISTIPVALVYAYASQQFAGEGVFWVVLFLHGVSSTLQSFVVSLFAPNQLAAFAIVAAWNVLAFLIYFATTLLTVTYYVGNGLAGALDAAYYVEAILAPSVSVTRAGFVSVNLFNLLCNGRGGRKSGGIAAIDLLGAPIIYTIVWAIICFGILFAHDSGYPLIPAWLGFLSLRKRKSKARTDTDEESKVQPDGQGVREEAVRLDSDSCDDVLQAKHLDKSYGSLHAVDDVSLGVRRHETVALLGINGGGKTTTHALIRGELTPDSGSVTIAGIRVTSRRTLARSHIASVPQFDGLDPLLTVREHLRAYARVKGVAASERKTNVESVMHLTNLTQYADRRAGALSGGNMRKLSLAIALLGNPSVLLLDELSSGVDSWTKRGLWQTLRRAGQGRATLLTSHSMEEAAALSNRVVIQASRILALDTITNLRRSHPAYELQLDIAQDQRNSSETYIKLDRFVRNLFPDAKISDEASARFEIPLDGQENVAHVFRKLELAKVERDEAGVVGYQVSPVSLESLFLQIVRKAQSDAARDEIGKHHHH
ncbi:related to ATP-binding cassette, sub-family A [Melanopsichium pennsylvanicum]|uniref:Related to ATP-binding cassette, sub-family A n=2 Tax=Melanopsichium pennsylvanicum TaxID=63383 RepID=A0AAJ4XP54_9BASI|nr:related to ATP-binding cassette, sub-family A [Melanopsichium pennsylvanicum 4]SNX85939.1 related to ATP-binding cassette, sub-family A [Melanopsichium pennsylvanicum]